MPEKPFTTPEMVSDLVASYSRLFDRSPGDLTLIHDIVVEHLEGGRTVTASDAFEHVSEHFKDIYPKVMADPRLEPVRAGLLAEYPKLPATPETRLREFPGDQSVGFAVVLGGAIGVAVAAAIVGYCLGGPDPAPGESVEVRCN